VNYKYEFEDVTFSLGCDLILILCFCFQFSEFVSEKVYMCQYIILLTVLTSDSLLHIIFPYLCLCVYKMLHFLGVICRHSKLNASNMEQKNHLLSNEVMTNSCHSHLL
jgi:hypothetical protein